MSCPGYVDFDYGVTTPQGVRFEASGYADARDWREDYCVTRIYFQANPETDLTRFLTEETVATIEVAVERKLTEDEAERRLAPAHEEVL